MYNYTGQYDAQILSTLNNIYSLLQTFSGNFSAYREDCAAFFSSITASFSALLPLVFFIVALFGLSAVVWLFYPRGR